MVYRCRAEQLLDALYEGRRELRTTNGRRHLRLAIRDEVCHRDEAREQPEGANREQHALERQRARRERAQGRQQVEDERHKRHDRDDRTKREDGAPSADDVAVVDRERDLVERESTSSSREAASPPLSVSPYPRRSINRARPTFQEPP